MMVSSSSSSSSSSSKMMISSNSTTKSCADRRSSGDSTGGGGGGCVSKGVATPCCGKVGLKRGPWTPKRAGLLRCGKSCRLRWMNYLRPSVKRGQIAPDEEDLILRLHRLLGNRWSLIAGRIPGRTDNEIKNYWNTHLSKKLISQGIDPRTHKPLVTNPNLTDEPTSTALKLPNPSYPNLNTTAAPGSMCLEQDMGSFGRKETFTVDVDHHNVGSYNCTTTTAAASNVDEHQNYHHQHQVHGGNSLRIENSVGGLMMMGLPSIPESTASMEEDDHADQYNNEDIFSSFLNSLINEEVFLQQQQQQQQLQQQQQQQLQQLNVITSIPDTSNSQNFVEAYGGLAMEAALSSSTRHEPYNNHHGMDC